MRIDDADNVALLEQARARAFAFQQLVERKDMFCEKYDYLFALTHTGDVNLPKNAYKVEMWALKQAIYLCIIEIRERTIQLNNSVRLLEARTGESTAVIRKMIEPPYTGV
jgi:hypothetical protein